MQYVFLVLNVHVFCFSNDYCDPNTLFNYYRKTKPDVLPKFNEIDGKVDRRSFCGKYVIEDNGVPR